MSANVMTPDWLPFADRSRALRAAYHYLPIAIFLLVWQFSVVFGVVDRAFLPSVGDTLAALWDMTSNGARVQQGARIPQRRVARFRLDRRRGRADRQDQRHSDQIDLCLFAAGMDRARHPQGCADHTDRRPEGQAHRGDARH
jgi:hypothetical protein